MNKKVIIITGGSSGIGEATAKRLAKEGHSLVLAARREDKLVEIKRSLYPENNNVIIHTTDVTNRNDVASLVKKTMEEFGRVDVLINNAGIMPLSFIEEGRVEDWDRMIDVNLKGLLYGINEVVPIMKKQNAGHIINVSSVAGRRVFPTAAVYCATKFGVNAITEGLRQELSAKYNIKVTAIEPGATKTELQSHIPNKDIRENFAKRMETITFLEASDIAEAIHYAISQPKHVNVTEILIHPTEGP
ncbi:MAG: SDR family oxidoreductase [Candidatus Kapaibacterium sp.]